ncbi:hypothetical protein N7G274_004356 [Stereocaulon virgatum]|uniref:Reverse transcriptase domain-containing protein n=1 Tax=Stereocaulon virgatum TaxID=373712 RepID=A0ABR4A9N4_9LECA
MESSSATAQSMQNITMTKLKALSKQQLSFEEKKQHVLDAVTSQDAPCEKVRVLLDAFTAYDIDVPANISLDNVRRFLKQSQHDPSVPPSFVGEWQQALQQALDVPSRKYEHATLFGRLVMEWLGNPNDTPLSNGLSESGDPFEQVGRKEMHDQWKEWESIVFDGGSKPDAAAIEAYLEGLFGSTAKSRKVTKTPIELLRGSMKDFRLGHFDVNVVKTCIKGILKTDLLSEVKRKALIGFQDNPAFLSEMSNILNMQVDTLDTWTWGEEAIPVEIRRALNSRYRMYMDEEIVQALLKHFIGLAFLSSDPKTRQGPSVRNQRLGKYQSDYFLSQLPSTFNVLDDKYQDDDKYQREPVGTPMSIKQSILHLLTTETLINTRLHGSFTILQSDFRWFGPSLPHTTILTIVRFFGVSDKWLAFMEKFLKAPLKFSHDGPNAQVQIRQCGVPIQHHLSDAFGEAVLFCLDFAVNRVTESNLDRWYDDLWFSGSSDAVVAAWETIQEFSQVMGLALNHDKTGSVHISSTSKTPHQPAESTMPQGLPPGQIHWGFL